MANGPAALLRAGVAVAAAPVVLLLLLATASPLQALADARTAVAAPAGTDPFAAVVPVAVLLAWALTLWLGVTVVLVLAGQASGALGRGAERTTRRLAPLAVRRAVHLALGLGLAAGVTCAGTASAAPPAEAPAVSAPSLDWPTGAGPAPAAAATPAAVPAAPAAPPVAPVAGPVVVAPGDTLWSLAARSLGPDASARQIAAAWPAWWSANREVVGADPDLLHPGDRLVPPAPQS